MSLSRSRVTRLIVVLLSAALVVGACGGGDEETGGGGGGGATVVKIGLISPLSGDLSALGVGIKNGADLAIKQANEEGRLEGFKLELAAEDDTGAGTTVGAQVAAKLVADPAVVAVIGTLNSSIAQAVQPILDKASITMVSPANTNPTLTQGDDPDAKKRPYKSYFRVSTTDAIQGPFAANYASTDLKAKTVTLIHDKKTYGQGLVEAFKAQFVKNGGKVAGTETVNPDDKDFGGVISKVKRLKSDLIYYGGEYPAASLLTAQAKQQGLKTPIMGGDGIYSGEYFKTAGTAALGDLATSVGAPVDQLESARDFVAAYEAGGYKDPYEAYGAYAFDAANVIIEGLTTVLEGKEKIDESVRPDLIAAVQGVKISGVTGDVSFDEYGDTTTKVLTVYKVAKPAECEKAGGEDYAESTTTEKKTTTTTAKPVAGAPVACWLPVKTDSFE